jgi:hypothetical protein
MLCLSTYALWHADSKELDFRVVDMPLLFANLCSRRLLEGSLCYQLPSYIVNEYIDFMPAVAVLQRSQRNLDHSCDSLKVAELRRFTGLVLVAGKTTLLRNLLENTTMKVGCIVNDVANVNIDAKLIRNDRNKDRKNGKNSTSDLADTIELANGCACKSTLFSIRFGF